MAPISLVLLNPYWLHNARNPQRKQDTTQHTRKVTVVLHVIKDVLINPIVFMTIIGIAGNFVFKQNIPVVIDDILEVLGKSFNCNQLTMVTLNDLKKNQFFKKEMLKYIKK